MGLVCLVACSEPPTKPPDYEKFRRMEPLNESYGVTYLYSENALLKAEIQAPYLREEFIPDRGKETYLVADSGIFVQFFDPTGALQSTLRANYAELYNATGVAIAKGNVVVENIKQEKLETERLFYNRDANSLYTDAFVKISTPEEIIMGDSMRADAGFTTYTVYKIRGIINVKE